MYNEATKCPAGKEPLRVCIKLLKWNSSTLNGPCDDLLSTLLYCYETKYMMNLYTSNKTFPMIFNLFQAVQMRCFFFGSFFFTIYVVMLYCIFLSAGLALLCVVFFVFCVTFPYGVPGQVIDS